MKLARFGRRDKGRRRGGVGEAFDGFEVCGELSGREASRGAILAEYAIPAAFEAMRRERKVGGHAGCATVKSCIPSAGCVAGEGKLRPDEKAVKIGARGAEEFAMKAVELEFAASGILAPREKKPPSVRVVGIRKKSEAMERVYGEFTLGDSAELAVEVRRVVERMALNENGNIRERVMALGEVMKICVRFPSDVRQGNAAGCPIALVIDGDAERARHASQPREIFAVPGDDEFKRRLHDCAKDAIAGLAAQTIYGMFLRR